MRQWLYLVINRHNIVCVMLHYCNGFVWLLFDFVLHTPQFGWYCKQVIPPQENPEVFNINRAKICQIPVEIVINRNKVIVSCCDRIKSLFCKKGLSGKRSEEIIGFKIFTCCLFNCGL